VKSWTLDFGEALQARGHRVIGLLRPQTPFVEACRSRGFAVYPLRFGPKYNPLAILRAVRLLRKERVDVAVVNISKDLEIGAVAARLCGIPVLHRVGLLEDYRGRTEERLRHRVLVDHVLVPSRGLREQLLERFGWLRPGAVTAIPNSKDSGRYRVAAGSGTATCVFGVTSQLAEEKGHRHLLEALRLLARRGVPARLLIAGAGALENALRAEVARKGLDALVEFSGFQADVPAFLSGLDAFVLPSLNEGFPNSLLEALWAGLPSAASRLYGVEEMLGDAGLTVPPGEPEPLADAMEFLARDGALRSRLGRAARRRAESEYDLRRNAVRFEGLLASLCRKRGPPGELNEDALPES
jgi:glycosyltransferase involved in cell wall biosynthesis